MSTPDLHTDSYISATVLRYSYYAWVTCGLFSFDDETINIDLKAI